MRVSFSRRLIRLETRRKATSPQPFSARILLVHPVEGLTGVLQLETGKPTMKVEATAEEREQIRISLELRNSCR